jgi:hypothetical protein
MFGESGSRAQRSRSPGDPVAETSSCSSVTFARGWVVCRRGGACGRLAGATSTDVARPNRTDGPTARRSVTAQTLAGQPDRRSRVMILWRHLRIRCRSRRAARRRWAMRRGSRAASEELRGSAPRSRKSFSRRQIEVGVTAFRRAMVRASRPRRARVTSSSSVTRRVPLGLGPAAGGTVTRRRRSSRRRRLTPGRQADAPGDLA